MDLGRGPVRRVVGYVVQGRGTLGHTRLVALGVGDLVLMADLGG